MNKSLCLFAGSLLLVISANAQNEIMKRLVDQVSETSLQLNVYKIGGSAFEGRMTASRGDSLAVEYIEHWFNDHHLSKPFNSSTPYLQYVPLVKVDYVQPKLIIDGKNYEVDKDWSYSANTKTTTATNAEIVFAGYGLSLPEYDDFKNIDVEGKIVLFKPGVPKDSSGKAIISDSELPGGGTRINAIMNKKALGVLIGINDPISDIKESRVELREFEPYLDLNEINWQQIPGAFISHELANGIVGGNIDSFFAVINHSGRPHSFNTHKRITFSIIEKDEHPVSPNIIGIINGTDTSKACVVVTAHHDHEGIIDGKTYYGADDNGTGTAALLEIAKIFGDAATKGIKPKRTIVFISTAAEEQGLIGSKYYVAHPVVPLNKTFCNINLDMLGRVDSFYSGKKPDSNYIYPIYHDSSGKAFTEKKLTAIDSECCTLGLDSFYNVRNKNIRPYSLITRSDNFPFIKQNIPAIWFFSGFHNDYHQPTDTPDKINLLLFKRRTQLVLATIWQLANE
jgi:hypothetical protein